MTPEERREIINLLKEVYQFHIGAWSDKAEEEFMEKLRDKIDQMEAFNEWEMKIGRSCERYEE